MAGLVPAIHAVAPPIESGSAAPAVRADKLEAFWRLVANSRALDAPKRVDGRNKPGHHAKPAGGPSLALAEFMHRQLSL
jgi:hypothetical protein